MALTMYSSRFITTPFRARSKEREREIKRVERGREGGLGSAQTDIDTGTQRGRLTKRNGRTGVRTDEQRDGPILRGKKTRDGKK